MVKIEIDWQHFFLPELMFSKIKFVFKIKMSDAKQNFSFNLKIQLKILIEKKINFYV